MMYICIYVYMYMYMFIVHCSLLQPLRTMDMQFYANIMGYNGL